MQPRKHTIKAGSLSWCGEMGTGRRRVNVNETIWASNVEIECEKVLACPWTQILVWSCWAPGCQWSYVPETGASAALWGVNGNICKMPLWQVQHRSLLGTCKILGFTHLEEESGERGKIHLHGAKSFRSIRLSFLRTIVCSSGTEDNEKNAFLKPRKCLSILCPFRASMLKNGNSKKT